MSLVTWLNRRRFLGLYRHWTGVPGVHGVKEFRRILARERSRADRGCSRLSLLVLDLGLAHWREFSPYELLFAFNSRVRETDEIGWFDRTSIGVLLPETSPQGAYCLAADLRDILKRGPPKVVWKIYCYPEERLPGRDDGDREDRRGRTHLNEKDTGASGPIARENPSSRRSRETTSNSADEKMHSVAVREPRTVRMSPALRPDPAESRPTSPPSQIEVEMQPLREVFYAARSPLTRFVDIVGASVALLVFSPFMATAAIAIRCTSPGPIIFEQQRSGLGGRSFTFYKFRTMCVDADAQKKGLQDQNEQTGPVFKMSNDPRITPVGHILRKTSIDEMPQLWNVIKGDMSLVGPRPPLPDEVEQYALWQKRRLEVTGGLTCIWQVSGRSEIPFDDWVRMDLRYAERSSLWLDLCILARTIPAVVTGRGAK